MHHKGVNTYYSELWGMLYGIHKRNMLPNLSIAELGLHSLRKLRQLGGIRATMQQEVQTYLSVRRLDLAGSLDHSSFERCRSGMEEKLPKTLPRISIYAIIVIIGIVTGLSHGHAWLRPPRADLPIVRTDILKNSAKDCSPQAASLCASCRFTRVWCFIGVEKQVRV